MQHPHAALLEGLHSTIRERVAALPDSPHDPALLYLLSLYTQYAVILTNSQVSAARANA